MPSDIDISALMASLSVWENWGYVAVAAVALCCFGEFVHECTPWFKKYGWWKSNGGGASALLLVAALAAEAAIQVKTNNISGTVIAFLGDRAARIEGKIAPRRLPTDAYSVQSSKDILVSLAKKVIRVESYEHDLESWALGTQIISRLTDAHIQVRNALMMAPTTGNIDVGVHVTSLDKDTSAALLAFLKQQKVDSLDHPPPNPTLRTVDTPPIPEATIFVGVKPLTP